MPDRSDQRVSGDPAIARRRIDTLDRWAPLVEICVLFVAVLTGLLFRLFPSTPLWLDEALSVDIASQPLGDITDRLRHDGHPPLYYWLLHGWISLFGTSDAAVRSLSVVFGIVALALVWYVARRHGGPRLAMAATAVMAASPYAIRYASETRMYSMVMVLALLGWIAVEQAWRRPRLVSLVVVGLITGMLLLTHYWAMFLIAAFGALLVLRAWRADDAANRAAALKLLAASAVGSLLFLPWVGVFLYQRSHTGTPWAPSSRPTRVLSDMLGDFSGGIDPEATLLLACMAVLLVFAVLGRRQGRTIVVGTAPERWVQRMAAIVGGTVAFGGMISWVGHGAFAARYAAVVFPFVILLVALGVHRIGAPWVRATVLGLVVALSLLTSLLAIVQRDRTQVGEVAATITAEGAPGDLVVVCPDQLGPSTQRELRGRGFRVVRYPDLGDPRFVDWVDYSDRFSGLDPDPVAARIVADAGAGTLWVVFSSGYRVVEDQCDRLVQSIVRRRPSSAIILDADSAKYFEYASLLRSEPNLPR
jgi:mannosyltransferase